MDRSEPIWPPDELLGQPAEAAPDAREPQAWSPDPLAPDPLRPDPLRPDPLGLDPVTASPLVTDPSDAESPRPTGRRSTSLGWGEVRSADVIEPLIWDTVPQVVNVAEAAKAVESHSPGSLSPRSPWAAPPRAAVDPSPAPEPTSPAPNIPAPTPPKAAASQARLAAHHPPVRPPRPNAGPKAVPTSAGSGASGKAQTGPKHTPQRTQPTRTTPVPAAPGVNRMASTRGRRSLGQLTVIGTNANAGRTVARLLTVTLRQSDPSGWDRAVDVINDDEEYAHAGDLLARDHGLTVVEAGADIDNALWQRAVDDADKVIVAVSAAGGGPAAAAALLDTMVQSGYEQAVQSALTVILLPVNRLGLTRGHEDVDAIRERFASRTHDVSVAPFDLRSTAASRNAWRRIVDTINHAPRASTG